MTASSRKSMPLLRAYMTSGPGTRRAADEREVMHELDSNLTGEGLVYIAGDLSCNGNFIFKGLIYVEGDVKLTGTPWVLGSMIVNGTTDFNFSAGNAAIIHSSEAITKALNNSMPALILSWREM